MALARLQLVEPPRAPQQGPPRRRRRACLATATTTDLGAHTTAKQLTMHRQVTPPPRALPTNRRALRLTRLVCVQVLAPTTMNRHGSVHLRPLVSLSHESIAWALSTGTSSRQGLPSTSQAQLAKSHSSSTQLADGYSQLGLLKYAHLEHVQIKDSFHVHAAKQLHKPSTTSDPPKIAKPSSKNA